MKPILQLLPNLLRLIALLRLLILPVTNATTMPENSDDDTAYPSKSWANDTSGVSLLIFRTKSKASGWVSRWVGGEVVVSLLDGRGATGRTQANQTIPWRLTVETPAM